MADLPVNPVTDFGSMLSSFPRAQAEIGLEGAQQGQAQALTQSTLLQNQRTQLQLRFLQHLQETMNGPINDQAPTTPGGSPATPAALNTPGAGSPQTAPDPDAPMTVASAGLDPAHIEKSIQQQYAVRDVWTASEMQQLQQAKQMEAAGMPGMLDVVKAQHAARIQNLTTNAQQGASAAYDEAFAVSSAPDGSKLDTLARIHPDTAAAISKLAESQKWTPEQTDQFVNSYADTVGNNAHRYSGRDIDVGTDGVPRDKQTSQPLVGGNPLGLSRQQYTELAKAAHTVLRIPNSDGSETAVEQWKHDGAPSPTAWINQQAAAGKDVAAATAATAAGKPPPPPTSPTKITPPGITPAGGYAVSDPIEKQALADPQYKLKVPPVVAGTSQGTGAKAQVEETAAARKELLADAQKDTQTAQSALTFMGAAKAVLDSKGAPVAGPYAKLIAQVSAGVPGLSHIDATNYQELAKYLGNSALPGIAQAFGTSRTTGNEVKLQMEQLSPAPGMTATAQRELLDTNIKRAQYMVDSASRARRFNAAGGDPEQFAQYNHDHWPAEKIINAAPAQTTKPMPAAPKLKVYADKYFGGDVKKASDYLASQGHS